jgi:hypothetical protein
MRNYEAFILGAITSGLVTWLWGKEFKGYVLEQTRGVRAQAVEGLQAVAESTEKVFDRGEDALRRAEKVLQDTKQQVGDALRTGQDAIRPTPAPRAA